MKLFRFALILVMMVGMFVGVSSANAALVSYTSGFMVQNLDSGSATITIHFYNRNGTEAIVGGVPDTVAGNSSNSYFPLDPTGNLPGTVPPGFDGSVVIESNTNVAATTNILGSDGSDPNAFGASYNGFKAGSPSAYMPLLMKANYSYNTWFSVQNLGDTAATINVTYSDGVTASSPSTVGPGAAAKFDQTTESHANGWVGSAIVSSTPAQPIAITGLEVGPTTLFAYDSFAAGSNNPVMPLVQENNYGYVTGVQIMNVGGSPTNVTVSYTPGLGQPGTACTEQRTIPNGQSISFALYVFTTNTDPAPGSLLSEDCAVSSSFVGSAKVTANSASMGLVAIVNQLNIAGNKGAAYNAFDPNAGTERLVFPLIMDRNYGYFTGMNIVNVGGSTILKNDLTCTISGKAGTTPMSNTFHPDTDLAAGKGWNMVNSNTMGNSFVGSASCVGPAGSKLVGSVNEVNPGSTKDSFLVYEGTNP